MYIIFALKWYMIFYRTSKVLLWRWQNLRGVSNVAVGVIWCSNAASTVLRNSNRVAMAAAFIALPGWLAATFLHGALWSRRSSSPILYILLYWLLSAGTSAARLYYHLQNGISMLELNIYVHSLSMILCLTLATIDGICFYEEVSFHYEIIYRNSFSYDMGTHTYISSKNTLFLLSL